MSCFRKFSENDIFYNSIKTYPQINFIIYSGSVYYNNKNYYSGTHANPILDVPKGHVSLYELNVDRANSELIYPFITKEGSLTTFRTITTERFNSDFQYGDVVSSSYPLSASISRNYYAASTDRPRITALKNTLNFYKRLSKEYEFSGSTVGRDLGTVALNLISIPSIFYGSGIKKGTVDLKFYISGSLIAQAKDEQRNGRLFQVGPKDSLGSGSVIGLALYDEGFLILTGAASILNSHTEVYPPVGTTDNPKWIYFANTGSATQKCHSSSFEINFQGINPIPTVTMFAHAPKVEFNHSNNPTYLAQSSLTASFVTGTIGTSSVFSETGYEIKNLISASYPEPTASFRKQTYISRIGIYDKNKNLIAIAKTANPVRKLETDSYTFKLKLDF